ncbi:MAG: hypothetical protein NW217_03635 [Hyphomicrobiaceae bacterium]|nr:hypothetical protein [Hyphomicrobiaceae bacterium]
MSQRIMHVLQVSAAGPDLLNECRRSYFPPNRFPNRSRNGKAESPGKVAA